MTKQEMAKAVREHATRNYTLNGWDYLVECWDTDEIIETMGEAKTVRAAIDACREITLILADQRADARAAGGAEVFDTFVDAAQEAMA